MPQTGICQRDRSYYYRGLLVLIGKDRIIEPREREFMLQLGSLFDFDRRFCQAAIDDLLSNEYITDEPVTFSSREIAECFVEDAIRLAWADDEIHSKEMVWINAVAQANGLTKEWLEAELRRFQDRKRLPEPQATLAIQRHLRS